MKTQRLAHWKIVIVLGFKLVMLVFDYTVFACHKDVGSMTKVVEDVMTIATLHQVPNGPGDGPSETVKKISHFYAGKFYSVLTKINRSLE